MFINKGTARPRAPSRLSDDRYVCVVTCFQQLIIQHHLTDRVDAPYARMFIADPGMRSAGP
jgi:hypothetical protein